MQQAYIINGVRTAIGNFGGTLSTVRTDDLAALVLKELMSKNPSVDFSKVVDVIMGCANQAGEDNRNVARMASLMAGLPITVPGQTINRLCASGLSATVDAARYIQLGEADLMISSGVENMTRGPLVMSKASSAFGRDQQLSERQSNFLLSVTHELKTPLASTKLYLQTLLKRDFVFEKRNELLQKALLENQRLEEIVDAILTASRLENQTIKAHKEWINLHELLTDLAHKYNTRLGKTWIIVELNDKISIESDLFMVKTILINLIENALKYAGTEQNLTLFLSRDKQNSKFGTKDAGPGISSEVQPDIFKKFVRLENEETRSQKGTGLGLFIASEFCKLIGGKLKYIDNQPKGAIFEITL